MNTQPLISVIVPVYNAAEYVSDCLESILRQTHDAIEVIVVNDGSTDGSGEICDVIASRDNRVIIIHQANAGVSAARNAGIAASNGEWIGFVDADDCIMPNMYETLLAAAVTYDKAIAICGHMIVHPDSKEQTRRFPALQGGIEPQNAMMYLLSFSYYEGYLWNKLFHRSLFETVQLDETVHFNEDLLLCVQLFSCGVCYIPDLLYKYCLRDDGAVQSYSEKRQTALIAWHQIIKLLCNSPHKRALRIAKARYSDAALNILLLAFYNEQDSKQLRRQMRRAGWRYAWYYFTGRHIPLKQKAKGAALLISPRLSGRMIRRIKQKRRDKL